MRSKTSISKLTVLLVVAVLISCSANKNESKYETYQEATRAYDFESAHKILDQMQKDYLSEGLLIDIDLDGKKMQYEKAFDYIFNAEAKYLCAKGDNESLNRIIFLLSDIPVEGVAIPEGTVYTRRYDMDNQIESHEKYINSATKLNQKCDNLVDLAIAYHSWSLVELVLPFYKMIPDVIKEGRDSEEEKRTKHWPIYKKQVMTYSNIDKDRAIKKINEAIDNRVFPAMTEHIK